MRELIYAFLIWLRQQDGDAERATAAAAGVTAALARAHRALWRELLGLFRAAGTGSRRGNSCRGGVTGGAVVAGLLPTELAVAAFVLGEWSGLARRWS